MIRIGTSENSPYAETYQFIPHSAELLEEGSFLRKEEKFEVSKNEFHPFDLEKLGWKKSYPDPATDFTLIKSIYFDSSELDTFRMHFETDESRFKVRVRQYSPNGEGFLSELHLELKEKTPEGLTRKTRFQISQKDLEDLKKKSLLHYTLDLQKLNPTLSEKKLKKRVERIQFLQKQYSLVPTLEVVYKRYAYEKFGIRVTFDQNLQFQKMSSISDQFRALHLQTLPSLMKWEDFLRTHPSAESYLMEVKYLDELPVWFYHEFIQWKAKPVRFSKYCFGVGRAT